VKVLIRGGELLLVVAEVRIVKDFEGAALSDGDSFSLVLVEDVLQATDQKVN
jgi:hypothetical protein